MFHPDCPHCHGTVNHEGKGCPARRRSGKRKPRLIRAWDCETVNGRIVLFLHSSEARDYSALYDEAGLSAERIFDWMIETGHGSLNIGFFFDYDVNQILKHLPGLHLDQLRARGKVAWRRWRIRHVPGKRFSLIDRFTGRSVTVWDVSGWLQCSFMRVCEDWKLGSAEERAYVASMKAKRADLSAETREDLIRYTTLECALLAEWMRLNLSLHEAVGIRLRAYSGAGSTAAALLRARGWRPPEVPPEVQAAAEAAFFGGRSETSLIGPVPECVYGYDINSAYPAAICTLPELHGARWHHVRRWQAGTWGYWRVRWQQSARSCWGLFPVRGARLPGGRRSISLLYPVEGEGWFHAHEVEAALECAHGCVEVIEGWITEPRGAPFAWVAEAAAERLKRKAAGDPAAFVLKVGLNSLYGKMAQHSGAHPMQSIPYAAAITSATRASLLRLMIPAGHDILLVATDGILSRAPLPVAVGPQLGAWEAAEYRSAWILQAGVYWAGDKCRTRGIDGRALRLEEVATAWAKRGTRATLSLAMRRVLSYRIACARGKPELTGSWEESQREIRFTPEPRRRRWKRDEHGALLTLPARVADYRLQQVFDEMLLAEPEQAYDDLEAMPHWSLDE